MLVVGALLNTQFANAQVKKATPKKVATPSKASKNAAPKRISTKRATTTKVVPTTKVDGSIKVKITTDSGVIVVKLSDSTPLHRDNFVKLVQQGFYDSLLFHRVIGEFMIQGGDPQSKNAPAGSMLGMGGGDMARIPAEFKPSLFHKKGALAAARDGNPERASSACQFYIVQGKKYSDQDLNMMELQSGRKFSPAERLAYKTIGGTPFLDQNYTVFGEVISGMEVIDKIAAVAKDGNNRPLGDVHMKMELLP